MPYYKVTTTVEEIVLEDPNVTLEEGVLQDGAYILEAIDADAAKTEASTATGLPTLYPLYTFDMDMNIKAIVSQTGGDVVTAIESLKLRLQALINGDGWTVAETDITMTPSDINTVY